LTRFLSLLRLSHQLSPKQPLTCLSSSSFYQVFLLFSSLFSSYGHTVSNSNRFEGNGRPTHNTRSDPPNSQYPPRSTSPAKLDTQWIMSTVEEPWVRFLKPAMCGSRWRNGQYSCPPKVYNSVWSDLLTRNLLGLDYRVYSLRTHFQERISNKTTLWLKWIRDFEKYFLCKKTNDIIYGQALKSFATLCTVFWILW
jgi:hypothetical protein